MYSSYFEHCEIKIATSRDTTRIMDMLKQIAMWLRDSEINQ